MESAIQGAKEVGASRLAVARRGRHNLANLRWKAQTSKPQAACLSLHGVVSHHLTVQKPRPISFWELQSLGEYKTRLNTPFSGFRMLYMYSEAAIDVMDASLLAHCSEYHSNTKTVLESINESSAIMACRRLTDSKL